MAEQIFFEGDRFVCCDGSIATVISVNRMKGYENFLGSDGFHRYDRDHELERGRVTGTHSWPPHPKTVAATHPLKHPKEVCEALSKMPKFSRTTIISKGETQYDASKLMRTICETMDKLIHHEKTGEIL